jgi:cation diffusion facilitator CzcD-associated flavoprotein CzcO
MSTVGSDALTALHSTRRKTTRMPVAESGQSISDNTATQRREVIVVGAGQAGLAVGYFLAQQGRDFSILEAAAEPAAAWRERWDSLRLFTSARYDALPGLAFPGDQDRYPGRDEVAAYLTGLRASLRAAG